MAITPSRRFAFDLLLQVERGGYASELLHTARAQSLSLVDRRLATEIVLGVLRWRAQLDWLIERGARRPGQKIATEVLTALRIGAYQLRFLDRIPASAAVDESVELAKAVQPRAAGFVNAVLRHLPRAPVAALLASERNPARRREVEFSHPAWLLERWSRQFGEEAAVRAAEYDNRPAPVAVRLNRGGEWPAWPEVQLESGLLLTSAKRVVQGDITKTPEFRDGAIRVQDEASQLVAFLLEPQPDDTILDVCAAPGSKAELLAQLVPAGRLLALDLHPKRASLMLQRMVGPIAVVVADASRSLPLAGKFARILVDAPCTGTGTLARNPEIRWRLQTSDPARLAQLQLAIARTAAAALAPAGRMVYSVCSLEPEEGPEVVEALLQADPGLRLIPVPAVLAELQRAGRFCGDVATITRGPFLQILPGSVASDGFFAAVIERRTGD